MSKSVDTRLVQIKLDSSDFQQNAKKTQDSIKQLEKDLELKDAAKGFQNITKASNKVDLSGTTSQIGKVTKNFAGLETDATKSISGITSAAEKVDISSIAEAANDVAGDISKFGADGSSSILSLNSAADKVDMSSISIAIETIGQKFTALEVAAMTAVQNITNKIVDSASQWVKSMAFGDITKGWEAYAEKTQSVQTIMSATRQDFDDMREKGMVDGKQIEWVEEQLSKLNWYTDETSYSYLDMADNIGKFTSQGIGLEDAVQEMMGIANWGALAGANTNEVSRAMYNISQAMGKGEMQLIDWKSIENANMATKEFKQEVLNMAVTQKTLEYVGDGIYHVVGAADDATVSISNFTENMSKGWFDKGVMEGVFDVFGKASTELYEFGDLYETVTGGLSERTSKYLNWVDEYKEQGTFTFLEGLNLSQEASDALKESIIALSDQELELSLRSFKAGQEAKTFGEAVESVHDAAKTTWATIFQDIFGNYEQSKKLWTELANDLWDIFVGPVAQIEGILSDWNQSDAYTDLMDSLTSGMLEATKVFTAFQDAFMEVFGDSFRDWLNNTTKRLTEFFQTVKFGEDDIARIKEKFVQAFTAIKNALSFIWKILTTIGKPLAETVGWIFKIIGGLFALEHTAPEAGGKLATVFDKFLSVVSTVLGTVSEVFKNIYGILFESSDRFESAARLITAPFEILVNTVLKIFGIITGRDMTDAQTAVQNFFYKVSTAIQTVLKKVSEFAKKISDFFKKVKLALFLDANGFKANANAILEGLGPIGTFFFNLVRNIQNAWNKVKTFFKGLKDTYKDIKMALFLDENGFKSNANAIVENLGPVGKFFYNIAGYVKNAWDKIKEFFSGLSKSKEVDDSTEKVGFFAKAWDVLKNAFSTVWGWLKKIPGAFTAVYQSVDDFILRISGQTIKEHFDSIKESVQVTWEKIKGFFTGVKEEPAIDESTEKIGIFARIWEGVKKVVGGIADFVKKAMPIIKDIVMSIWEKIAPIFGKIKEQFKDMNLADLLKGGGIAALGVAAMRITKFVKDIRDGFKGDDKEEGDTFVGKLKAILDGIKGVLKGFELELKAAAILEVAASILVLAFAINMLSKIDTANFKQGLIGVASLLGLVGLFFAGMTESDTTTTDMIKMAASMIIMALAMSKFGKVLSVLSKLSMDEMKVGLVGLGAVLAAMLLFTNLASPDSAKDLILVGAAMLILAQAVNKMAKPLIKLGGLPVDQVKQGIIALSILMLELAAMMYIISKNPVGKDSTAGLIAFSAAILAMVPSIAILGNMDVAALKQGMISLALLMGMLALFAVVVDGINIGAGTALTVVAIAASILMFIPAIKMLGEIDLVSLAKGVGAIAAILALLAAFFIVLDKFTTGGAGGALSMLATAVAVVVLGAAMHIFVAAMKECENISWADIGKGLLILAGVLGIIVLAGIGADKAVGGLLALAGVILAIGVAAVLLGTAMLIVANAIALVASLGEDGYDAILTLGRAFSEVMPGLLESIGEGIKQALEVLLKWVKTKLKAMKYFFKESLPLVIQAVVATIAGILEAVAEFAPSIAKSLRTILKELLGVVSEFLGGVLQIIIDNLPKIWEVLGGFFDGLLTWLGGALPKLVDLLFTVIDLINIKLEENIGTIIDQLVTIANNAVRALTARLPEITEVIFNFILTALEALVTQLENNKDRILSILMRLTVVATEFVFNLITSVLSYLSKKIPEFVGQLLDILLNLITGLVDQIEAHQDAFLKQLVRVTVLATEFAFNLVTDTINSLADTLEEKAPEVREALINLADAAFKALLEFFGIDTSGISALFDDTGGNIIQGLINGIKRVGAGIWEKVKEPFVNLWNGVKNFFGVKSPSKEFDGLGQNLVQGMINGITSFASTIWNKISGTFSNVLSGVRSFFGLDRPISEMRSIGDNTMAGFRDGINGFGGAGGLWSQVSGTFTSFINNVKSKFRIKSPSRVFEDIGENVDLGFIQGLNNYSDDIDDSAISMGDSMLTTLSSYAEKAGSVFNDNIEDPVITPVLDLSEIQNGAGRVGNMLDFGNASVSVGSITSSGSNPLSSMGIDLGSLFGSSSYGSGLLSSLSSGASLGGATTTSNDSALSQVFNFNITPTPNQDVNAIADAVERKLTRGIKQRGASF